MRFKNALNDRPVTRGDGFSDNIAAASNGADDRQLARAAPARILGVIVALVRLARLATDVAFVRFDNARQQVALARHPAPDAHRDAPCGLLIQIQVPRELVARHALLGVQHQGDGQKPLLERDSGLVEDRAGQHVEAGVAGVAVPAADAVAVGLATDARALAVWARRRVGPAHALQVLDARLMVWEPLEDSE